ncbi:MAG: alpha-L-fucosidase [Lentisphaeria bacterium]|nr:alpha-L-fucosidase [Lentisphaeria bacterium]
MTYEERMKWFHEARFGIYVHFGLYSLLERGEWTMYSERIPKEEYAALADRFDPVPGCAGEWVQAAKRAGAKYMVLTTRHHEGFSLFDSKYSDFTSAKRGCRRDIVREYVEAARAAGLKVGLYYSLLDWRYPGYFEPGKYPENKAALVAYVHNQVRELMTNYGKIDLLEYDGGWMANYPNDSPEQRIDFWHARELNAMVRELQPGIIINNRSGLQEDIDTPEQVVKASASGRAWETCMCIGDSCCWGYTRFNPNWKTPVQLIQHLVTAATGEGNFLLNIGPGPDGRLRAEELERLAVMGDWLEKNGEAIRSSRRCELIGTCTPDSVDLNLQGPWARKGNTGYWFCFRWPGTRATAVRVASRPLKVTLLGGDGTAFPFTWDPGTQRLIITELPSVPPDPNCTVLEVLFEEVPRRGVESDKSAWLSPAT